MKKTIFNVMMFFCLFQVVNSQERPSVESINEFFELVGTKTQFESLLRDIIIKESNQYQSIYDSLFFDRYTEKLIELGFDEIRDDYVRIYQNNFTKKEVDALIDFYKTDVGKSISGKYLQTMIDLSDLGIRYGETISIEIEAQLYEEKSKLFEKSIEEDCSKFMEGEFEYYYFDTYVKVTRTENQQIEKAVGTETKIGIEWVSNNKYILSQTYQDKDQEKNITIKVTIYEVDGNKYKFIAIDNISNNYSFGELTKIDE